MGIMLSLPMQAGRTVELASTIRVLIWFLLLVPPSVRSDTGQEGAPVQNLNLVVILADDHAAWATGAYGNNKVLSPNIDRLAEAGARFTNAFVTTPLCSPSRATFLTGLYSSQTGVNDLVYDHPYVVEKGLRPDTTTWAEVLQHHGYSTGFIGKWNLGSRKRFHPTNHGFDYFAGYYSPALRDPMSPTIEIGGEMVQFDRHTSELFVDLAVAFLEEHQTRPFALVIAPRETQEPWEAVPSEDHSAVKDIDPDVPQYDGADDRYLKGKFRDYYASVHTLDRGVGALLNTLDRLELSERTIVLYTSDHGILIGHHGLHGRAFARKLIGNRFGQHFVPNYYDEIVRIPLIIRWPDVIAPGTVVDQLVSNVDFFPSILGMLSVEMPAQVKPAGNDFSPLFHGASPVTASAIYFQHDTHTFFPSYSRGIRTEQWKLVRTHFIAHGFDSLFDMVADPGETTNLIDTEDYAHVVEMLDAEMLEWQETIDDPILPALQCFKREIQTGVRMFCDRYAYGRRSPQ